MRQLLEEALQLPKEAEERHEQNWKNSSNRWVPK
jgi:hypothetical protein